ncbi:MAG: pyridoxal phosphate-dependent aminotransferase [Oscillospiraceae bacterium]|nr:pyridoxal phosphate-dependent aminotransferase [Oscillospiraceae bacterium]
MKYNFDEVVDRRNTGSLKWDIAENELAMWVADMDFKTAPEITEALINRANHGIFGYSTVPDEWYDAYIGWWKRRHGFEYKREELIFSTGVIPIISSCVRKLTTAGENVLIMTPVYNIFFNCIKNNGRNVVQFPLVYSDGEYSIDWEELEKSLSNPQTTLMLLCDPHNPIGKIWNRETLARIGELAYDNGVTVISDEIHCDITDPGCEYIPFASASEKCRDNCVVCVAPTKTFNLAGLQTAAAIVPNARLRHKVWRALNTDEVAEPNAFAVAAAVAAFTKGGEWLDELRGYIYENKTLVKDYLTENIPRIKLVDSNATYLLWLDCTELKIRSDELARIIRKQTGLYLSNGVQFGNGENFLRMNIACPRRTVKEGLERLKKAVEQLK